MLIKIRVSILSPTLWIAEGKNDTWKEKLKGKRKLDIKMGNSSKELERCRKREYS